MAFKNDLTDKVYGRLTVLSYEGNRKWLCVCKCGNLKVVHRSNLVGNRTTSCGCYHKERTAEVNKPLNTRHGKSYGREYKSWQSMKERCTNLNAPNYDSYGGRGIQVCERWLTSFEAFFEDMGERPLRTTLDRKEVNGNYEPGNCRWATAKEQSNNRRNSRP